MTAKAGSQADRKIQFGFSVLVLIDNRITEPEVTGFGCQLWFTVSNIISVAVSIPGYRGEMGNNVTLDRRRVEINAEYTPLYSQCVLQQKLATYVQGNARLCELNVRDGMSSIRKPKQSIGDIFCDAAMLRYGARIAIYSASGFWNG